LSFGFFLQRLGFFDHWQDTRRSAGTARNYSVRIHATDGIRNIVRSLSGAKRAGGEPAPWAQQNTEPELLSGACQRAAGAGLVIPLLHQGVSQDRIGAPRTLHNVGHLRPRAGRNRQQVRRGACVVPWKMISKGGILTFGYPDDVFRGILPMTHSLYPMSANISQIIEVP
jgi:hypothetical protein